MWEGEATLALNDTFFGAEDAKKWAKMTHFSATGVEKFVDFW